MVSTVSHVDERKERYEAHLVVGEENAALPSGSGQANLFGQRVVDDRTTTRGAIGGASRRRAPQHRPRSVKRGRNFQGVLRRIT